MLGNTESIKKNDLGDWGVEKNTLIFLENFILMLNYIAYWLSGTDENIFRPRGALLLILQIPYWLSGLDKWEIGKRNSSWIVHGLNFSHHLPIFLQTFVRHDSELDSDHVIFFPDVDNLIFSSSSVGTNSNCLDLISLSIHFKCWWN